MTIQRNTSKGGNIVGRRNVVDIEYIPTKRKILGMEFDVIDGELKLDYKNFGTPQKKKTLLEMQVLQRLLILLVSIKIRYCLD